MRDSEISRTLLLWYDMHAREMPWRVGPAARAGGARPNPYHVWLSEVMLQQTTVAAVRGYFLRFIARWPRLDDLARAPDSEVMGEWAGLGYYARARNLLKCARAVMSDHAGRIPQTRAGLQSLPGIGPYTSAAIAAIAFDRPETVVDGNVERVMSRLYRVKTPLPAAKPELARLAARLTPRRRPGDHAQAMMDLGATLCTPKSPACDRCPLASACRARAAGVAADLPRRLPKPVRPARTGIAYVVRRADGAWLLERRPGHGLLGGMLGWPGSDWCATPEPAPPLVADWQDAGVEVRHTFTHFHLTLTVLVASVPEGTVAVTGHFVPDDDLRADSLPTVMRKVHALAAATLRQN